MIFSVAVAMAATLAFCILFSAPRRHWLCCSIVGGLGWLVNIALMEAGAGAVVACFSATLALTFFSRLFSFWRRAPITVFLIAGIFPLVPGAGIYYTAYYLFASDFYAGMSKGIETIKFAGVIALGILVGLSLPAALFRWAGGRGKKC